MAMRLSGTGCWIYTTCTKDGDDYTTHVFCMSRMRGIKCPNEGRPGAKPFELGPECFRNVRCMDQKSKKN